MLVNKCVYRLPLNFNYFFFSSNLLYVSGLFGVFVVMLPSYFFFSYHGNSLSFLFLNYFFFKSFVFHFLYLSRRLFFFNYARLKMKGIGHSVSSVSSSFYKFFFFSTSFFYFYVPLGLIFKLKKKRMLLLSNNLDLLKKTLAHMILLKKITIYRKRGVFTFRHILLSKEGKRKL